MFKRTRYQFGWLRKKPRRRGPDVWVWTYRSTMPNGGRKENSVIVGSVLQYPSKTEAWRAAEGLRLSVNDPRPAEEITFGAVIDRYLREAIPERLTTRSRYQSWIKNHIKPHWAGVPLAKIKPLPVEKWIEGLSLAPKSKGHIRSMMHVLFNWAMRWELIPFQINPMNLVHIKGSSKREREPRTLTTEEFRRFIEHVPEPCRTMCVVAACLGLRVSEMLGLKWGDFDWNDLRVRIQRSWVAGVEGEVKTLYSKKWMPVDPILAELLQQHKTRTTPQAKNSDWVFANPESGKPYWPGRLQEHHLVPAGIAAQIGRVGWHTFRHTYSTLLRAFGVDVKVQQELLRHADIRTTMNIYTQAVPQAMREAHGKVVEMLLPPMRKAG
jgi:integrase